MTKREREKDVTHAEIQLRVLECFSDLRPTPLNTSNISTRLIRNDTRLPTTPIQISTSLFHKKRHFLLRKKKSSTYAIFLSSFLNHLTSLGDPNIKKQITDNNNVQAPKNNEIHLQGASPPYFCAWDPMPYMERLPMMPKPALADWKKREREECSSRVYQLPMTRTKPGLMVHSKNPWRARRIMRWVQFCAAPMQVTQTPGCEEEERVG